MVSIDFFSYFYPKCANFPFRVNFLLFGNQLIPVYYMIFTFYPLYLYPKFLFCEKEKPQKERKIPKKFLKKISKKESTLLFSTLPPPFTILLAKPQYAKCGVHANSAQNRSSTHAERKYRYFSSDMFRF